MSSYSGPAHTGEQASSVANDDANDQASYEWSISPFQGSVAMQPAQSAQASDEEYLLKWHSLFDLNVARENMTKSQSDPLGQSAVAGFIEKQVSCMILDSYHQC